MARRKRRYKSRNDQIFTLLAILSVFISLILASIIGSIGGKGFNFGTFVVVFFITLIVLVIGSAILSTPKVKGIIGEKRVAKKLARLAKKYDGKVINDVIIPGDNDKTSQIDHVLIVPQGIFVIETKNYSGRIYGNDYDQNWTQVLAYGKVKNKLYNPLKQNATHLYRLKELLNKKVRMESVVVIVSGNTKYITSESVYTLGELRHLIYKDDKKELNNSDVEDIYNQINYYKDNPVATKKEHIQNIKQSKRAINNNICPRCGGDLVLRESMDGRLFYGCSNYPKCTFTKTK